MAQKEHEAAGPDWTALFRQAGIPPDAALAYGESFNKNRLSLADLPELDKDTLATLNITTLGDQLTILRMGKQHRGHALDTWREPPDLTPSVPSSYRHPSASVKPPSVTPEMTPPQFRKFRTDWTVYRTITSIPSADQTAHLYSACDSVVQNSVINERPDFLQLRESEALDFLETIVTTRSNPAIHRMKCNSLKQGEHELIQDFMVRLRSASTDCVFECPNCQFNLSDSHLRDQFVRGLCNTVLQADILTKASQLPSLTDVVNYALSVESALRDQAVLEQSTTPDPATVYAASQNHHKSQRNNRFKQSCLAVAARNIVHMNARRNAQPGERTAPTVVPPITSNSSV